MVAGDREALDGVGEGEREPVVGVGGLLAIGGRQRGAGGVEGGAALGFAAGVVTASSAVPEKA